MSILACCALVPLASCGSSTSRSAHSGAKTFASPVPTRALYIAQVDPLCHPSAKANALIAQLRRIAALPVTATEVAAKLAPVERAIALEYRQVTAAIARVPQPPEDHAILAKIASAHADIAANLETIAGSLENHEPSSVAALRKQLQETNTRRAALEQAYGFKVCGTDK